MARPRKEGFEYFSHDTSSMSDEKLDMLVTLYGAKGYAFFFLHLEYIYKSDDLSVDVSGPLFRNLICAKLKITPEEYNEILHAAVEYGLFDAEHFNDGKLVSNGVKKRVETIEEERKIERERKQKMREKARENAVVPELSGVVPELSRSCPGMSQNVPPEKEKEKEKEKILSPPTPCSPPSSPSGGGHAVGAETEAPAPEPEPEPAKPAAPLCPQDSIVNLYHELLPDCPKVRVWSDQSRAKLAARWREDKTRQTLDWWRGLFTNIARSDFLMGRAATHDGRPFTFSLSWLVKPSNFEKVVNGNYANRASPQPRAAPQYPQRLTANQAYMMDVGNLLKGQGYGSSIVEQPNDTPRTDAAPRALPGGGA